MRLVFGLGRVRRVLSPLMFFKASGKGPGSRGGRIVGHSKSGRPIYYVDKDRDVGGRAGFGRFSETRSGKTVHATDTGGEHEDAHREFTPDDHRDAAEAHEAAASMPTGLGEQYHRRQAAAHRESANEPLPPSGGSAERGRVLGKTKSGQPVHAGKGPPNTRGSEGPDTWSDRDHEDAAGLHVNAMQAAASGDQAVSEHHRAWAQYHHGRANKIRRSNDEPVTVAHATQTGFKIPPPPPGSKRGGATGHVIGTTKSGKPMYAGREPAHAYRSGEMKGWTAADHSEAAEAHTRLADRAPDPSSIAIEQRPGETRRMDRGSYHRQMASYHKGHAHRMNRDQGGAADTDD